MMIEAFLVQSFAHDDFPSNIVKLQDVAGYKAADTKLRKALYWRDQEPEFWIEAAPKKFVSCQLTHVLLGDESEIVIRDCLLIQVRNFYQPLVGITGHPMVDFVQGGPFKIQEPEYI